MSKKKRQQRYQELLREGLSLPETAFSPEELENLQHFAEASGIQPEGKGGHGFDLSSRPYLAPLYNESRCKPKPRQVIMKAAQMGLTVRMLYRAAWFTADVNKRMNTALMFPTQEAVEDLHKSRFRPMMQSSERMLKLTRGNLDSLEVVRIGVSNMRFRGMGTGINLDSFPADVLLFDEVRLMDRSLIERAFARTSASQVIDESGQYRGIIELNSTAGYPHTDIHHYFERSTQNHWHTRCPAVGCENGNGFVMAEAWPKCVDPERMRYICPKCGKVIENPQDGFYGAVGPADAEWEGYAFNQILKGTAHLPELWRAYLRMFVDGGNPAEFLNSYLGKPHIDEDAILVTPEVFMAACQQDASYRWPEPGPHPQGWVTAMGIDQRPSEKHVTIVRKSSDERYYLAHLEIVEESGTEASDYCAALARRWNVDIVVVDSMPSYDLAVALGRSLDRRMVWLAEYVRDRDQPLEWSDQGDYASVKSTSGEAKYEWLVKIDRYKHLLQFLMLWRNRRMVLPVNISEKTQSVRREGKQISLQLGFELRKHLENIVKAGISRKHRDPVTKMEIDTGQYDWTFRHRALDPHFVHSMAYAVAGLMRVPPKTQLFFAGEGPASRSQDPNQQQLEALRPKSLYKQGEVCGNCKFYEAKPEGDSGYCTSERHKLASSINPQSIVAVNANLMRCHYYRRVT